MANKNKKKTFTPIGQKSIDQSMKLVEKASQPYAGFVRMTADERKRHPKPRRGSQQIVPMLLHLFAKYGLTLPSTTAEELPAMLLHVQRLQQLEGAVLVFHETILDELLRVGGGSWQLATALYSALRNAARRDPGLATELEPVRAFFRPRRAAKKQAAEAPKDASAATPDAPKGA